LYESNTRIAFIEEYLSNYENKIKLRNSRGLYDEAKFFELFAKEIAKLWFGQEFNNLNTENPNQPCVDLISDDEQTYIQVTTVKNLPAKIKATLEKIEKSTDPKISAIKDVKFIALNNDSIEKVGDYSGENKIGKVSFTTDDDLITTRDLLQKATNDLDFQLELFELLKRDVDSIEKPLDEKEATPDEQMQKLFHCARRNSNILDFLDADPMCRLDPDILLKAQEFVDDIRAKVLGDYIEWHQSTVYKRIQRFACLTEEYIDFLANHQYLHTINNGVQKIRVPPSPKHYQEIEKIKSEVSEFKEKIHGSFSPRTDGNTLSV